MVLMSVTEKALHGLLRCPIPLVLNKTQTTCHMKKKFLLLVPGEKNNLKTCNVDDPTFQFLSVSVLINRWKT